jgi:flavin reductase (DIM6/NTAB) family NADH-FMN oxidoreductase RutF
MKTFDPAAMHHSDFHRLLVGGVAPRPIALVSSLAPDGTNNLSPFSFFNVFGVNPAVCCFSPAFSGRTGAPKDTMLNLDETDGECTISIVTYDMVHQISLASAPFAREIDEFEKSGLTKRPSVRVKPPGVAESPFIMEARLLKHVDFGRKPGSANMMICEILYLHVRDEVFNAQGGIDPEKMDQVARMGGAWYTRANQGLFQLPQPNKPLAGVDRLPEEVRTSPVLTGRELAQLATLEELPEGTAASPETIEARHTAARKHLATGDIESAWRALLEQ